MTTSRGLTKSGSVSLVLPLLSKRGGVQTSLAPLDRISRHRFNPSSTNLPQEIDRPERLKQITPYPREALVAVPERAEVGTGGLINDAGILREVGDEVLNHVPVVLGELVNRELQAALEDRVKAG